MVTWHSSRIGGQAAGTTRLRCASMVCMQQLAAASRLARCPGFGVGRFQRRCLSHHGGAQMTGAGAQ